MPYIFLLLLVSYSYFTFYFNPLKTNSEKLIITKPLNGNFKNQEIKAIPTPSRTYPWTIFNEQNIPKITKEYFLCRGSSLNKTKQVGEGKDAMIICDCHGSRSHTLPIIDGQPNIYPALIDLLNYIQNYLKSPVVITCGHCCPKHWAYLHKKSYPDPSRHMQGAAVDFYIKGLAHPSSVISCLNAYYSSKNEKILTQKSNNDQDARTPAWKNHEITIKWYDKHEGRNDDNLHPYPYFCMQLTFDRESKQKILIDMKKAFEGYLRETN